MGTARREQPTTARSHALVPGAANRPGDRNPSGHPAPDLTSLPAEVLAMIEPLQQQARVHAQELTRHGRELTPGAGQDREAQFVAPWAIRCQDRGHDR